MIVRNETGVLGRCFASLKDFIDYYVIVDTGSIDGTPDFIRETMAGYGIEGEVHSRTWKNFGENRQEALELALNLLKPEDQEILELVYFRHQPVGEAATKLGVARAAIEMRLTRARRRLAIEQGIEPYTPPKPSPVRVVSRRRMPQPACTYNL